jgi:hypothetical protein
MTGAKLGAIVTSCLVIMYVALLSNTAIALLQSGDSLSVLMGGLLLAFPVLAIWSIITEFIFGIKVEKLGKQLQSENRWPEFHFELRPSGRPLRASADSEFERFREAAMNAPEDWRSWFILGLAYDAASDRPRARASMRKAIRLYR